VVYDPGKDDGTDNDGAASAVSELKALLADISSFRDQCRTAQRALIPAADPRGGARMAYGVAADQLDALIKRHGG